MADETQNALIQALIAQAMRQDNGDAAMQQEVGAYDALGPGGFKRMTGLGTMDERGQLARQGMQGDLGLLQQQMQAAQQFAQPQEKNWGSVGGNIAGGIGDVLRSFAGGMKTRELGGQQQAALQSGMGQQQAILGQQDAGRFDAGTARIEAMRKFLAQKQAQQQAAPIGAQPQAPGFGLPGLTFDPTLLGG